MRAYPLSGCRRCAFLGIVSLGSMGSVAHAAGVPLMTMSVGSGGAQEYTVPIQILIIMGALTLLPAALMMMTCFARIIIVFSLMRQALGLQQSPSNQVLIGLALFLTFFIMRPVFDQINTQALQPYLDGQMPAMQAVDRAEVPLRQFMLKQTRQDDLALFERLSHQPKPQTLNDLPMTTLIPAFATSEMKTAFEIGFLIFIPFMIIDLVVASVLMAMGMMMLSPLVISLPFKLMLFVMIDGWAMIMGTLAASYGL